MIVYIYTLSDPISDEIFYCGKTINLKERFNGHMKEKHNEKKRNWILSLKKIGLKPKMEIIEICDENDWHIFEKYWISQLKSWGFNLFNLTEGGEDGITGYSHTQETKNKISKLMLGRKISIEWRNNISKGKKGVKFSDKHIENLSKSNLNQEVEGKSIYQIDRYSGKILNKFDKIVNALKFLNKNLNDASISKVCKGKSKSAFGFYWCYVEDYEHYKFCKYKRKDQRKILQIDFNGNIVNEYDSIIEAANKTNMNRDAISHCANGDNYSHKNYIWIFKDESERINIYLNKIIKLNYKILQIEKNTNKIINKFDSIKDAENITNFKHIGCVCNGKRKSSGGFLWKKVYY
jgi:group I intron endonuclease